jgi:hypothetical protein
MRTAGKPTTFAPRRGKFIPPQRVAEQRRQAVGVGSSQCFYHGAPPIQPKGQYLKSRPHTNPVVVQNTDEPGFQTVYQGDFAKKRFNQEQFSHANSYDSAFGKVPHGGFIKFHDVETRAATGNIPNEKYEMVYGQSHVLGAVRDDGGEAAAEQVQERATRRKVNYEEHVSLGKARERMNMRTLNFSELPGQELNPKPMRKNHQEYGGRHKMSQITWAYHG